MIGGRINRPTSLGCRIDSLIRNKRSLSRVAAVSFVLLAALIVFFASTYGSLYFFRLRLDSKFEKRDDENPYREIVEHTLPKIQDWYTNHAVIPTGRRTFRHPTQEAKQCVVDLFTLLTNTVNPVTSIELIDTILTTIGIAHLPMVRYYLQDYLSGPIKWEAVAEASQTCLIKSSTVSELACTLNAVYPVGNATTSDSVKEDLEYAVHFALVLERLTTELQNDVATLHQVADMMVDSPWDIANKDQFFQDKRDGIATSLKELVTAASEGASLQVATALRVNILEAVLVDIEDGREENALLGLDLASIVSFDPVASDQSVKWHLGRAWVDAYIGWNLRFVASQVSLEHLGKLLIPSVACTLEDPAGESFLYARVISLAMSVLSAQHGGFKLNNLHDALPKEFHKKSLDDVLGVPRASQQRVQKVLSEVCNGAKCRVGRMQVSDTIFLEELDEEDFQVFYGFVVALTAIFAGYGCEILVLQDFLGRKGWSSVDERNWRFAQFAFPWLASTTLGLAASRNFTALISLVPGLWKFGFPEVTCYTLCALYPQQNTPLLARVADLLNGIGLMIHHTAASLLIAMLLVGVVTPDREILTPILFLVAQHWLILFSYYNKALYVVLELMLDVCFQWSIVSGIERIVSNHWSAAVCALLMLMAHEFFLVAAGIDLYVANAVLYPKPHGRSIVIEQRHPVLPSLAEEELTESTIQPTTVHSRGTTESGTRFEF